MGVIVVMEEGILIDYPLQGIMYGLQQNVNSGRHSVSKPIRFGSTGCHNSDGSGSESPQSRLLTMAGNTNHPFTTPRAPSISQRFSTGH